MNSELPTLEGLEGDRSTLETLRRLAAATLAGSILAIACDLLLRGALGVVSIEGGGRSWMVGTVVSRLAWPLAAALLWLGAPLLASGLEGNRVVPPLRSTPATAARIVGVAMAVIPIAWVLATTIVRGLVITMNGAWASDGRIFAAPQFYSDIVVANGPWVLAGMALVTAAGHLHLGHR